MMKSTWLQAREVSIFELCRQFVDVNLIFRERKRKIADFISRKLEQEPDQLAALRAISKIKLNNSIFKYI